MNLQISDETFANLQNLQQRAKCETLVGLLAKVFAVYDILLELREEGGLIFCKHPKRGVERIDIIL